MSSEEEERKPMKRTSMPSKLDALRAKVHSSRAKVVQSKKRLQQHPSSSAAGVSETLPLHLQPEQDTDNNIEQELLKVKEEYKEKLEQEEKGWQERIQTLERLNSSLQAQQVKDEEAKDSLSDLIEGMEQQSNERKSSTELKKELDLIQEYHHKKEHALQQELADYVEQHEDYFEETEDDSLRTTSLSLKKNIHDFDNYVTKLRQRISSLSRENRELASSGQDAVKELLKEIASLKTEHQQFASMGEKVVRKLQFKIAALKVVLEKQIAVRKQCQARIQALESQNPSMSGAVSVLLRDSNTSFELLETQVSKLKQELMEATEQAQRNSFLLKEKEQALQQLDVKNEILTSQLLLVQNSNTDPQVFQELEDVRHQLDALLLEEDVQIDQRSSVQDLKHKILQLSPPETLLRKLNVFKIKVDDLIQETNSKKSSSTTIFKLSQELQSVRVQVDTYIGSLQQESEETTLTQDNDDLNVRIMNDCTGRLLDLQVPKSSQLSLYDGVYNLKNVKQAHIRKWPNPVAECVKNGIIQLQLAVLSAQGNVKKVFSVQELQTVTTQELSQFVNTEEQTRLMLQWTSCPDFSPRRIVKVTNATTNRSKEILVPISPLRNVFDYIYNHDSIREENIRSWPEDAANIVADKLAKVVVKIGNKLVLQIEDLPTLSTLQLSKCVPTGKIDFLLEWQKLSQGMMIRVRVTNQITKRSMNLMIPASSDISLFDTMYNSPNLLAEKVREWPENIVAGLKNDTMEINCVLLDQDGGFPLRVFSLSALKTTTTKELAELLSSLKLEKNDLACFIFRADKVTTSSKGESIRVRVTNQVSKRSKDLDITVSSDVSLFDGMYNSADLLAANVRKWPQNIVDGVHKDTMEINCVLLDPDGGFPSRVFSLSALKTTTSKDLVELISSLKLRKDLVSFVLKADKVAKAYQSSAPAPLQEAIKSFQPTGFRTYGWLPAAPKEQVIRVRIANEASKRSKDLVIVVSSELSLFDAMYNSSQVLEANIRKWPKEVADGFKSKTMEINCVLLDQDGFPLRVFSVPDLKTTTTTQLVEVMSSLRLDQDLVSFVLRSDKIAIQVKNEERNIAFKPAGFRNRGWGDETSEVEELRIRISNESTGRFKDLVVPINSYLTLYDGIYNKISVKEANVRKWPSEKVHAVKNNDSEIKCLFYTQNEDGKEIMVHAATVEDLKEMKTDELLELLGDNGSDLIKIVLRCELTPVKQVKELKQHLSILESEKAELGKTMESMKEEHRQKQAEVESWGRNQRKSIDVLTSELALFVSKQAILEMKFAESNSALESSLDESKKKLKEANEKSEKLEKDLENAQAKTTGISAMEIPKLEFKIKGLEREKKRLEKRIEENPLQQKVQNLGKEIVEAKSREASLKEQIDTHKARLLEELKRATARETSARAELSALKEQLQQERNAGTSRESELKNEIISYQDKLQQERHLLSCLSTELYDSNYRESELREELYHLESKSKHDGTVHTDETPVQIVDAEYAGEDPRDTILVELDSAKTLNESLSIQVRDLQNQVEKLGDKHAKKEKEYTQIMERDEELKASITSLTSILDQTTVSNKALANRVAELETESQNLLVKNKDILERASSAESRSQMQSVLLTEAATIKGKLEFAIADKQHLTSLLEQKEVIIENFRGVSDAYDSKERNRDVLAMLEKSHNREETLQAKYSACFAELEELKESSKDYQDKTGAKLEAAQKEVEEHKYANKLLKGIVAKLNQMNESLEDDFEKTSEEASYLRTQNKSLAQIKFGDLQNKNALLVEEINFLRDQKSRFTKKVAKLETHLEKLAKEKTEGDMQRMQMEATISEFEEERKHDSTRDHHLEAAQKSVVALTKKLKLAREEHFRESEGAHKREQKLKDHAHSLEEQVKQLQLKLGDPLRAEKTDSLIVKVRELEGRNKKLKSERKALKTELSEVQSRMEQIKREIGGFSW